MAAAKKKAAGKKPAARDDGPSAQTLIVRHLIKVPDAKSAAISAMLEKKGIDCADSTLQSTRAQAVKVLKEAFHAGVLKGSQFSEAFGAD